MSETSAQALVEAPAADVEREQGADRGESRRAAVDAGIAGLRGNSRTLSYNLLVTGRDTQRILDMIIGPICRQHGLTQHQVLVMASLSNEPQQRPSRLSDRLGILRTNFTALCHRLEELKLVKRTPSPNDRRAYLLRLTAKGEALLESIDREIETRHRELLESLDGALIDDLVRGHNAICSLIDTVERR